MLSNSQPASYLILVKQNLQGKGYSFHFTYEETEGLRDLARDYVTKWVVSPFWESRRKKVREEGPFSDPQC